MKNSSHKTDVRYAGIRVLREVDEKEVFAQELISERCAQSDLSKRDKNLLTELVNGVIRHRLPLDTLISFFSNIPLNKIEPWVLYARRTALVNLTASVRRTNFFTSATDVFIAAERGILSI